MIYMVRGLELNVQFQCREAQTGSKSKLPPLVCDVLHTPGQPLDPGIRDFFEYHFHCDFSRVRVHIDASAMISACIMNTLAYTVGHHIVFGEGQFRPWTPEGKKLLAHELAHVVQQGQTVTNPLENFLFNNPNDDFEQEADECACIIMSRAAGVRRELCVAYRTNGPVFQGWWIDQHVKNNPNLKDVKSEDKEKTHQFITRSVLNEQEFRCWFHQGCKDLLILGSADPDIEKSDLERRLSRELTAIAYHGWDPCLALHGMAESERIINGFIKSYVTNTVFYINNNVHDLDYSLREELGKALHAAQDKGAHLTPCQVSGRNCTSVEQDIASINKRGWDQAFENTRRVLRDFYLLLNNNSRIWLRAGPSVSRAGRASKSVASPGH